MPRPQAPLDIHPLVLELELQRWDRRVSVKTMFEPAPNLRRSYLRARSRGTISHNLADTISTKILGSHPAEIYGEAWFNQPTKQ